MYFYQPLNHPRLKGFSLIEFMIAIAVSSIILLAVAVAWQSGFRTQQSQTDVSRLNETIRFSMDLLAREIRLAGLINTTNTSITPAETNFCSAATIGSSIAGANDPAKLNPAGAATGGNLPTTGAIFISYKSDAIRVRYYGEDPTAGTGTTATTEVSHDCLGYPVPAGQLVEDTLYVALAPDGEPALWCHTSNPTAATAGFTEQPMVSGVESLQILYGEVLDLDTGIVNQYVPWQLVNNHDNIRSVKVSIVARSAHAVSLDTAVKTFYHFGNSDKLYLDPTGGLNPGTTFTPSGSNDILQRLRLPPMSTEIAIRNFGYCG